MKVRSFVVLVAVAAAASVQSRSVLTQSAPADQYLITDLGTLGGARSDAFAINELGQVAGSAERGDGSTHAFFFDQSMHDLGTIGGVNSAATGFSQKGQVVGWSESAAGNIKGFIYSGGVRRSLGTLGGSDSAAYAINNGGDVVGSATTTGNAATRAFLYRNGAMKSLGTLGGTNSAAMGISDSDITGWSSIAGNGAVHGFLIPSGGAMTDIGTLGGDSQGLGVNGTDVVGRSVVASGATHAFLYTGGTMIDLGTLGGRNSEATGISQSGLIVGNSELAGVSGTHAFLYSSGVMTDLNTRVPAGSGWVLESAAAVDFGGDIVGVGTINGHRHAYRLSLRVPLTLFATGRYSEEDSNRPSDGIQVGRSVRFVATVHVPDDANALNIVYTDTLAGPIEVQSASIFVTGDPCAVSGRVVTCRIPMLGPWFKTDEEISVFARVTGPGPVSHTAHVTADNAVPNPTDTLTEHNIGIALKSFTLSTDTIAGGKAVSARAELTSLPPSASGARVTVVSSDPAIAPVPSTFVVQGSSAVRTFNIVPRVVAQPTTVTITATYGLVTIAQTLTVVPPTLTVLSLSRSTMIGACQTAIAKVTLSGSAPPSGASVTLSATTPGVHVPAAVTIGPGETSASVTVTADAAHTLSKGVFTASFGGTMKELPLAVRPIYLTSVTVSPASVTGGSTATATATIECAAPAGGIAGTVTSTNPAATPATGSIRFAAGATTTSVAIGTRAVSSVTRPAIRVTVNAVAKSAALDVQP
jgi:probable HAF family extracellular repeat protein